MKSVIGFLVWLAALSIAVDGQKLTVPLGGNSWITGGTATESARISDQGWRDWMDSATVFSTYVYLARPGDLTVSADLDVPNGSSRIQCAIDGVSRTVTVSPRAGPTVIGDWKIGRAGYVRIDMRGLSRSGPVFANVKDLQISGSAVDERAAFVKNNDGNYFYWGRRGPSVHLNFDTSKIGGEIEYFYNEIIVPAGNDVVGSYFMANGFAEGYFGIQVNSETERRVLFSVWSPFKTDDPKQVPPDKKIVLLKKGRDVVTGEFGNEGSGGQSFLRYNWRAGETYRFLLKGEPVRNGRTNYTAWFFVDGDWRLIASFSRPATRTYLTRLYSFLENFNPETGNIARGAYYQNQWVRTNRGEWKPITNATFTYDNTARQNYRRDYSGGTYGGRFFLRNCGFFSESTPYQSVFSVPASRIAPRIDLAGLE